MNNELTKTFPAMTTGDIATLAQSGNLDDMHLATRLARRLVLAVKQSMGTLGIADASQGAELATLIEITDQELARI